MVEPQWPLAIQIYGLPKNAAWLDQIEIWFSILQRKLLSPNHFDTLGGCCRNQRRGGESGPRGEKKAAERRGKRVSSQHKTKMGKRGGARGRFSAKVGRKAGEKGEK
jgi:hypothetical protein